MTGLVCIDGLVIFFAALEELFVYMSSWLLVNAVVAVPPCRLAVPQFGSFLLGGLEVALPLSCKEESLSAAVVGLRGCCCSSFFSLAACGLLSWFDY